MTEPQGSFTISSTFTLAEFREGQAIPIPIGAGVWPRALGRHLE